MPEVHSYLHVLRRQFEDSLVILLLVLATVSLIASRWSDPDEPLKWLEAASIYVAVLCAAGIQAVCDYGREQAYFHLRRDEIMSEQVQVVWGQYGLAVTTFVSDLVVGDIVLLAAGDRVPADCLLIEEMDMFVDERLYYPERPGLAEKQASQDEGRNHTDHPDPILLSGSLIMAGHGKAVVLAVGKNTLREKEMESQILAREKPKDSALEHKLRVLASIIGTQAKILALVAFILFSIFWLSKLLYTEEYLNSNASLQALLTNL